VEVAGLVVARQRPHTAKGFVFVLMEDETGMINVIVRPDIYDRDRLAIRGEPFLWVFGKLAKDDGAVNVIAEEVRPLTVKRSNPSPFPVPSSPEGAPHSPYAFLRTLRRHAPGSKDWG
jgi:error-prone DNA polymerase